MEDRVAIFIDGSNLYHALRDNCGRTDLNFNEFQNRLCGARRLFRTYYYNIRQDPTQRPEGHREQQEFLDILQKSIDIMLATDLLHFAWNNLYNVAILVSGDGDFAYALQAVKNMGKHVEVAYFESNVSKDLLEVADNRHLLDRNFFKGFWRVRRRIRKAKMQRGEQQNKGSSREVSPPPPTT
jgi:uncharacterized LabA/DUF88 family protein